jgi:hypothetical protein
MAQLRPRPPLPDVDQWKTPREAVRYRYANPGGVEPSTSQEGGPVKTTGRINSDALSVHTRTVLT